jgi:hypothetical protein
MQAITTVGLDIAKSVFQVHGVGADGHVVIRRQLKRRYVLAFFQKLSPCLVGIEACRFFAGGSSREYTGCAKNATPSVCARASGVTPSFTKPRWK